MCRNLNNLKHALARGAKLRHYTDKLLMNKILMKQSNLPISLINCTVIYESFCEISGGKIGMPLHFHVLDVVWTANCPYWAMNSTKNY